MGPRDEEVGGCHPHDHMNGILQRHISKREEKVCWVLTWLELQELPTPIGFFIEVQNFDKIKVFKRIKLFCNHLFPKEQQENNIYFIDLNVHHLGSFLL